MFYFVFVIGRDMITKGAFWTCSVVSESRGMD